MNQWRFLLKVFILMFMEAVTIAPLFKNIWTQVEDKLLYTGSPIPSKSGLFSFNQMGTCCRHLG